MDAVPTRLKAGLTPVVATAGADLEDVTVERAGRRSVVRVVVDRDGGVSLDDVADLSRVVSEELDRIDAADPDLLAGAYVLEVSSPGVDRPLTEPRHWRRNVGRRVSALGRDGATRTGRLVEASPDPAGLVVLEAEQGRLELAYRDLDHGQVEVEFTRVDPA